MLDLRTLQMRMLRVLEALDATCKSHGIRYGIYAGTLIGAVREKGFIPWDDDVDVIMPRPDYERFIAHSREWLPAPYEFVCAENDPMYPLPFGKVQDASTTLIERFHLSYLGGIYVDVFPIDGMPDNIVHRWWKTQCYRYLTRALYLVHRDPYRHGHGISSWVPLLLRRVTTMGAIQRRIRRLLISTDYAKASWTLEYTARFRGIMPKEVEDNFAPIMFEGKSVMGIRDYDTYLSQVFGDYMTPPKVEKRHVHNFDYCDLDHPYREYVNKRDIPTKKE